MDTVYSTKKYFQNLGSDYYRSPSVNRQMGTDYTSYRGGDTVGRRSTLGPSYTHMSKYSYATDHSVGSHYGGASQYNGGWGLWRDTGNLSPTTMSSTKKRSIKSFSIILMTAAFIVVLAVLSVAGLAFYFSTFRNEMDNSVLAFDGHFHVLRGDVFTTGLKYNHTAAFRQKRAYYEKLIETALQEKGGMSVTRCEIDSFGGGPLVQVKFRVLLDTKSMPMTMTNVEEHIKQSLLQEVTSLGSPFKNIKIDQETMDVKRLLDHDMLKTASFMREIDHQNAPEEPSLLTTKSNAAYDEKVSKKSGVIEKTIHKFSATTSQMGQGKAANTPTPPRGAVTVTPSVIKGSFEITKTEADIAQKKDTPPAHFHTTPGGKATTMKVKSGGGGGKFSALPSGAPKLGKIDKIEKVNSTNSPSTITESASTTTATSTTSTMAPQTTTPNTISTPPIPPPPQNTELDNVHKHPENANLPQLDVNLFTSAPILDSQPWHPISVPGTAPADQRKPDQRKGHPATVATTTNMNKNNFDELKLPQMPLQPAVGAPQRPTSSGASISNNNKNTTTNDMDTNKNGQVMETVTKAPSRPIYYQSFTNPTFSLTTLGIERLGAADVRPYPLPVNKLYDEEGTAHPLDTGMHLHEVEIMNGQVPLDELVGYDERFEHLGGGVSAKKPDVTSDGKKEHEAEKGPSTPVSFPTSSIPAASSSSSGAPEQNEELGEILLDLLEMNQEQRHKYLPEDEEITAEVTGPGDDDDEQHFEETTKLNFINIREHILSKNKVTTTMETTTLPPTPAPVLVVEQTLVSSSATGSKLNNNLDTQPMESTSTPEEQNLNVDPSNVDNKNNPNWSGPSLFPMHTTWELINGTVTDQKPDPSHLRRVYNDTLQAWIVENAAQDTSAGQENNKQESGATLSKKQEGTIQNISVIFDTLATKLGITPDVSSKSPPFQNKVRQRTTTPKATAAPTTTTTKTTEPETITSSKDVASDVREEVEYEEYDDEEVEEEVIPTTTTTTTKKPRRKMTTRKSVTTSKPKSRSTPQPAAVSRAETRSSVRAAETTTTKLPPKAAAAAARITTTTARKPTSTEPSIVSRPVTLPTTTRTATTTTRRPVETTTTLPAVTESIVPPIFQLDPDGDDNVVPIILSQPAAAYEMSSEAISFGKAEVEVVVDPDTVYADLLRKQAATTKAPPLVTLLPVRSNSGIRTFRTPMQQRRAGEIETRRAFAKLPAVPPPATIVRTSMRVGT